MRLLIDTLIDVAYRTAQHQPGRLRSELTSQEIQKYVAMCLKPGKSTGPDRSTNRIFLRRNILASNYSILHSKRVKDERILRIILLGFSPKPFWETDSRE